jgi:hypothetical protein
MAWQRQGKARQDKTKDETSQDKKQKKKQEELLYAFLF